MLAVLGFHLWPDLVPGGFIGVSTFFTLSGFVITRSLLVEHDQTGALRLRAFWGRRFRRLWPAALVCLSAIVLVWLTTGWMTRRIAGDIGASLVQVANWRFLAEGDAYGVTDRSPVAHFWSLAIEEQLYLLLPYLVWLFARRREALAMAFAGVVVISLVATALADGDPTVVYYSTFTRAGELAVGAAAAVVLHRAPAALRRPRGRAVATGIGVLGLLTLVLACGWTSLDTGAYDRGALTALAIPSTALLVAACWSPMLSRTLSVRPLLWLGEVSYGIYLIHWPLLVALDQTALPDPLVPWSTLAVTLVAAWVSLRVVEEPIRRRQVPALAYRPAGALLALAVVLGCIAGMGATPASDEIDFEEAVGAAEDRVVAAPPAPVEPFSAPEGPVPFTLDNPMRVGVFGDSTAVMLAFGIGADDPRLVLGGGARDVGCPLGRGGEARVREETGAPPGRHTVEPSCDWTTWGSAVEEGQIDLAVVMTGTWDIAERRLPALDGGWWTIGEEPYDAWLADELAGAADALHAGGAERVAWLSLPQRASGPPDPAVDRFNELVAEVAASRPWMAVLDYPLYLRRAEADGVMRPDDVHLDYETAATANRDWLNQQLLELLPHRAPE